MPHQYGLKASGMSKKAYDTTAKKETKTTTPKMNPIKEEDKYQIEEDVRTLERAEEIRKDPERLSRAVKMTEEKMDRLKSFVEMNKKKTENK